MKVWAVTFKERYGVEAIVVGRAADGTDRPLLFADSAYDQAHEAFRATVQQYLIRPVNRHYRIVDMGGVMAHSHVTCHSLDQWGEDIEDVVELRPYDVIGA